MTKKEDLIAQAKDHFKQASEATESIFEEMVDDLRFLNGDQWPQDLENQRRADGRPCLKINKLPAFHDRIVGNQRKNRPAIKVHPVDDNADKETARILQGLIRNIEVQSNASVAYDTAYDGASSCGLGAFRIITDYSDDDTFDQDIRIKRIKNQFTVFWDPNAQEADFSDAEYMFITEKLTKEAFNEQYPNSGQIEFDAKRDSQGGWVMADGIRIAEYFYKQREADTLYMVQVVGEPGPRTVWKDDLKSIAGEYAILKERSVERTKIMWLKMSGAEILEGPQEWPGKYIPVVIVTGKELTIENDTIYRGIVRHAKDPQRLYNYNRSQQAEVNALAPRAPFIVTPKQIGRYRGMWDTQHKRSYPYLLFDPDPKHPGEPQRSWPQPPSIGIQQEIMLADQELHDTTGLYEASLGERSNEQSGKAILARKESGDTSNIVYPDNLSRSMQYAGKILIDLIPKIYDVPRMVRVIGEDDSIETVKINEQYEDESGKMRLYDITTGKYDVTVATGPNYQTQRQEAAEAMTAFIGAYPDAAPIIGDLLVKNMDWPGADEIAGRLKKLVPPQALAPDPEPGEQPPPQPPPDPRQEALIESEVKIKMMEAEKSGLEVEQAREELRKKKAEADQAEIEARIVGTI